jgi:hypothetical protein
MFESRKNSEPPKPFQYSLWSLLVITTLAALVLGIAKWANWDPQIGGFLLIVSVVVLPIPIVMRWRHGTAQIAVAVGMFTCMLLIAVPLFLFNLDALAGGSLCFLIALGIAGLPVWMGAMLVLFACRSDRLERRPWRAARGHTDERGDKGQSDD